MTLTRIIQEVIEQFTQSTGIHLGAVSSRALNEGKALRNFITGRQSMTVRRADLLLQWLSDNWPKGANWPETLPRPRSASDLLEARRAAETVARTDECQS